MSCIRGAVPWECQVKSRGEQAATASRSCMEREGAAAGLGPGVGGTRSRAAPPLASRSHTGREGAGSTVLPQAVDGPEPP